MISINSDNVNNNDNDSNIIHNIQVTPDFCGHKLWQVI